VASYTCREVVTRRVEYAIPSGDVMGEFDKAYNSAVADWRRRNGKTDADRLSDDWARVEARDDEVVIVFDVEEPPDADRQRIEAAREAYAKVLHSLVINAGHGHGGQFAEEDLAPIGFALNRVVNGR
jgi:hypothetical protein